MTTSPHSEWSGLESFVDDLRRLEAPRSASRSERTPAAASPLPRSDARLHPWLMRGGLLAAGIAAIVVLRGVDRTPNRAAVTSGTPAVGASNAAPTRSASPTAAAGTVSSLLSPWPAVALAQSPPGAPPFVPYAPLTALDGSRLKPRWRTYVRLSANDYHTAVPHEVWVNELDTVRFEGGAAWRLVRRIERQNMAGEQNDLVDTLWMRRSDLRPLARHLRMASLLATHYRYTDTSATQLDSIFLPKAVAEAAKRAKRLPTLNTWQHTLTFRRTGPFIVSSEYLRLLLRAAPLSLAWRASVQVEQHPYNQPANAGFVNLRVTGVDTVQLFNGRFPVWRVAVEGTMRPETWFVSQQTGETLITDGPVDLSYPESRTVLLYGIEETVKAPSIRRR